MERINLEKGGKGIVGLAPFLSDEALDILIESAMKQGELQDYTGLYPFLSDKTLHKLAEPMMKNGNATSLKKILPFL